MNCIPNERGECFACGRKLPTLNARRQCRGDMAPTLGTLVVGYGAAVVSWIAAGRPTRNADEIAGIVDGICSQCDKFSGASCSICGCAISRNPSALRNMVAMATKHCPLGKW